ncbi:hypothetical protein JQX08_12455 [Pseudomonas sp. UL073]|uniref:ABC-2 family transporter protein n=1 Tax=Zestomonas insulae TaxID=2809017 RepID=A0ABS2IFH9_9GAMM|nr:hypothetical protein [Pseudomonas insulae]
MIFSLSFLLISALLSAQFSGRQPATVALDIGLSVVRLLLPIITVLLVQELVSKEFDRRYYLGSLSYPCPRQVFILGRYISIAILIFGLLLLLAVGLGGVVWWGEMDYVQGTPVDLGRGYAIVLGFIYVDFLVGAAVASFLAIVASTSSFVLIGTLGFMLIARSFSSIVELLVRDAGVVSAPEAYRAGVGLLGYFLPDLGALDVRSIALYGKMEALPADWPLLLSSSLIYVFSLLALSVWMLQRKRFS